MSRILFLLVGLFVFVVFSKAQNPTFLVDKIAFNESKSYQKQIVFVESMNAANTDFIYQRMEWEINPEVRFIKGKVSTHFRSKTTNLSEVEFDLSAALEVDSIVQRNKKVGFKRNSNIVLVVLDTPLGENNIDSLSIYYKGIPPQSGFGSFTLDEHGPDNTPVLWTLSEPYGAMEWWPCKQSLSDKIDSIDVFVRCSSEYRTASNGVLVSEINNNGKRIMHWRHRHPIATYLVAIAVTNYQNYSDYLTLDDGREIEVLNYVYPENLDQAKTETPITTDFIGLYNDLVGEYPFANEKYGHAQFGWGGGMEHQTMSFMGNFSFGLIAHELAHQWFGDYITLGSWQDIWLNEGFATYLTGLAYEKIAEPKHWPVWKNANKQRVISEPGGSVFVRDTTSISQIFNSRLSYAKGGYLLHMQRWILGDEIFFKALQNYFADDKIANGFAYSEDWIRHAEAEADTSLTEFFNDWLYGEGYPTYRIQYWQARADSMVLELSQTTSHQSVEFFEMPVPVRMYSHNKTDSADFRLNNNVNNQEFVLKPGFMVDEIVIDPEDWMLCKTGQITGAPTISVQNQIIVFPNPATGKVSFYLANGEDVVRVQIFSIEGNLLNELNENDRSYDFSNLSYGTYLLRVETANSVYKTKVIKQ